MKYYDRKIVQYATEFKDTMMNLRDSELFVKDDVFFQFPNACCGDTSCLLAEYLVSKGIPTLYVWGDYEGQTHAWLVVNDERVFLPTPQNIVLPKEIKNLYDSYGGNSKFNNVRYTEEDVCEGLIVDITADQFGEEYVYVGYINDFYRRFEFREASEYSGLGSERLRRLYSFIFDSID